MKTGQMLFVALGGMMLGTAGTLVVQTGLLQYEVTLDIRPRGPVTVPPPSLSSTAGDPYASPPIVQNWEPAPLMKDLPMTTPALDDEQIAEIVSIRERIGQSVAERLHDLTGSECDTPAETFSEHLRAAAGVKSSARLLPEATECPLDQCPAEAAAGGPVARGQREARPR